MTKRYHVYGVGAALVDTEIHVTDADLVTMGVEKSLMTLVDKEREKYLLDCLTGHLVYSKRTSGGSTANAIIAIAQLGGQTFYSCKVGDDDNGHFYLSDLQTAGVDCHANKGPIDGNTGTCLVMITPDAERTLCTFLGINANLSEHDIEPEVIAAAEYVYFEAYMVMSPATLAAAIRIREIAEKNNVKTALSFSDPGVLVTFRDSLWKILSKPIDLLFCNRREAFSWAQTENMEIAVNCLKKIAHTFVITLGAEGALVYDGTQLHNIAPYQVQPVDTSGAGDMFAGAFLFGITQGKDFPTAGSLASFAAATVVSNYGARLTATKQQQILIEWNNFSHE
jgi:sugar/nucleoside kinase (ribokinase family)